MRGSVREKRVLGGSTDSSVVRLPELASRQGLCSVWTAVVRRFHYPRAETPETNHRMRLIQTLIPESSRDAVIAALEEEGVDYAMSDESARSDYSNIAYIPVESGEVERIVARLRDAGIEREGYMVVSDAETIVSDRFEQRREDDTEETDVERISREELRSTAQNLSRSTPNYVAFTIVSAIVATAGLLENSAAVVVGSMVIAPLIGPAMASCVGSVIGDDDLFWTGATSQVVGLAVAIASATLFALSYRVLVDPHLELLLVQQIAERVHPGMLALAIALGAGVAGALSLTSGADEALVGVMIAVALIPPAATVGLGIAYADPVVAIGAAILVAVNVLSINAVGILTVWVKRYRPDHWYDVRRAQRITVERLIALGIVILVLTSFLALGTLDARENAAFEREVDAVLEDTPGEVIDRSVGYDADVVSPTPNSVTVRMAGASDDAAATIREEIRERTGLEVSVRVIHEESTVAG
ncbi:TIGR00341 family protein [Halobacteria archaeon AArc-m2/3/4]|uniref:TIGR00341 family protein n=1 Tax=Natronoglomus mannanivorans TaxID=2979990 RepID=A0ABT2Q943_9EURY|nr:TIGR00341 family protein [Halobacteria archaeon AArc-m2/3/4]